jgi:Cu-Zn family superoxide dismutase
MLHLHRSTRRPPRRHRLAAGALVAPLALAVAAVASPAPPAAATTTAATTAPAAPRPTSTFTYQLSSDPADFPEGVTVDRSTGSYFVTVATSGAVLRGRLGRPQSPAEVFLPAGEHGRTTATGIQAFGGRLYIAGAFSGAVWVYDIATRALVRRFDTGRGGLINDLTVTPRGDVFVTDSLRPSLYRIRAADVDAGRGDTVSLAPWLDLTNTVPYQGPLPNGMLRPAANGIVNIAGGRVLLLVQNTTGQLFRVDVARRSVTETDLGGYRLVNGDGLAVHGRTLYAIRNIDHALVTLRLYASGRTARVVRTTSDPTFRLPTTIAVTGSRLLVVNSQLDRYLAGQPADPPFTLSSIRRPRAH